MTFLYFAYGSNMLPARLLHRCPSALVRGVAIASGSALSFSKPSKDHSGKATLLPSADGGVPGVLFGIDLVERDALDRYEGVGYGYRRRDDFLVVPNPVADPVLATTYIATTTDPALKPFDWYLALVVAGALHHKLDPQHIATLRNSQHLEDTELNRPSRRQALDALLASDIGDYRTLLD